MPGWRKAIVMSRTVRVVLVVGLVCVGFACGDDDDGGAQAAAGSAGESQHGGRGGTGGASGRPAARGGTGGSGGSAGTAANGGAGTTSNSGDPYTCKPSAPEAGGGKLEGESCCEGLGKCAKPPTGPEATGYSLAECKAGADLKCVPVANAEDADAGSSPIETCKVDLPATLIGDLQLEGRCVSSCFVAADPSSANLGQSSCDAGSKCVPCYSPITGQSTGACNQFGDKPSEPAPQGFAVCGEGDLGYCVRSEAVMTMNTNGVMLPQLTCSEGFVCAPKLRVLDSKACFAHCESAIGGPGACIAGYIVDASNRSFLMRSSCAEGELCAPCVSPLDMQPTGACM